MDIQSIKQKFSIIGNSIILDRAIDRAIRVASTDISVLVTGESGVGKESIPKIIHSLSKRKYKPYISVNCGAIPEGTIESELFGHEKGAFTGALNSRNGYFETADGGTIFLDEVGDLPMITQVKLLRILESGEFIKVGSSEVKKTDVRVVAATNVDLIEAIKKNKFREDLYYRLNTVEIKLPSLRDRKEDINLLFKRFALEFADKYKTQPVRLDDNSRKILENYRWYGNIRQLKNFVEQISIFESGKILEKDVILSYLPDNSYLPSVIVDKNDGINNVDREFLYQSILDIRVDLNKLKKLMYDMVYAENTSKVDQNKKQNANTKPENVIDIGTDILSDKHLKKKSKKKL